MSYDKLRETVGDGYAYLASPYSKYKDGPEVAYHLACRGAGMLIDRRVPVFCPIAQSHAICQHSDLPANDHDVWLHADWPLLSNASALVILALVGWDESFGVQWEMKHYMSILTNKDRVFFMPPCGGIIPYGPYMGKRR